MPLGVRKFLCCKFSFLSYFFLVSIAAAVPAADPVVAAAEVMIVDPLHDLADIQLAVDALALDDADTSPMVELMTQMSRQLSALNIQQATTKEQNALLLVSARKTKVDETVGKLTNHMSVRAVRLNFRILFMVEDMLTVLKPDGHTLVPTNLEVMKDLSAAAAVVLEEIVRLTRFGGSPGGQG